LREQRERGDRRVPAVGHLTRRREELDLEHPVVDAPHERRLRRTHDGGDVLPLGVGETVRVDDDAGEVTTGTIGRERVDEVNLGLRAGG